MTRIAYVNGRYLPHRAARVHIDDRGYQFADGVYEVIAITGGHPVDEDPHLDRLDRSLRELRIALPMSRAALKQVLRETARRNRVVDGTVYVQMTRGVAPRDHPFPQHPRTQVVMTAKPTRVLPARFIEDGIKVVTMPDVRWGRCDIKSIALLPNVLAKQAAREQGAFEGWLVASDGTVTEGSSTNAWIVTAGGELITRAPGEAILNGITRLSLIALAREEGLRVVERSFTVEEARRAREAFITSTTSYVLPVTQIDDGVVANGKPGSIARRLRQLYERHMASAAA